jgi:hypothetical protein
MHGRGKVHTSSTHHSAGGKVQVAPVLLYSVSASRHPGIISRSPSILVKFFFAGTKLIFFSTSISSSRSLWNITLFSTLATTSIFTEVSFFQSLLLYIYIYIYIGHRHNNQLIIPPILSSYKKHFKNYNEVYVWLGPVKKTCHPDIQGGWDANFVFFKKHNILGKTKNLC